jgi:hypothetical protein
MVFPLGNARISAKPIHTARKIPGDEPAIEALGFFGFRARLKGPFGPERL